VYLRVCTSLHAPISIRLFDRIGKIPSPKLSPLRSLNSIKLSNPFYNTELIQNQSPIWPSMMICGRERLPVWVPYAFAEDLLYDL
jgi:hypothetical protein